MNNFFIETAKPCKILLQDAIYNNLQFRESPCLTKTVENKQLPKRFESLRLVCKNYEKERDVRMSGCYKSGIIVTAVDQS